MELAASFLFVSISDINFVPFEEVVKLDLKYIEEWSLRLDIKIIFRTILVVLKREGSK